LPALPDAPSIIKQRLHWDVGTDANAITLLHFKYAGAPPVPLDMSSYCTSFNALTAAEWPIYLDAETTYLGTDVVDLTSPTSASGSAGTSVVGTRAGSSIGASSAVLINYPISRRYRGGKPRSYLPWGTADDLLTRNSWKGASLTDFQTGWDAIQAAVAAAFPIGSATFVEFVSVSYYGPPNRTVTGSTGRVRTLSTTRAAPLIDLLGDFTVSGKVGSQRRRNLQRT
jgi:hypothetical protein